MQDCRRWLPMFFKKKDPLKAEVEALKLELKIKSLEAKIQQLETENSNLEQLLTDLHANTTALIEKAVNDAVAPVQKALDEANDEIKRLNAIINKDSSNSSKPPSSNGFKEVMNNRVESDKKQGGQFGHKGYRLELPENMDELEESGVLERHLVDYSNGSDDYISRYKIDIQTKVIVTEYRFAPDAKLPPEFYNEVSYGDETKATLLVLLNEGIVPKMRLGGIISGLTHQAVNISPATMESFQKDFAKQLVETNEEDKETISEKLQIRSVDYKKIS